MSALAIAMLLTGAGEVQPVSPPPVLMVPPPPSVPYVPVPPAPAPSSSPLPARPPELLRGHFIDYFTPADYPAGALRPDRFGYVGFRLAIGRDGRVTNCTITVLSGSPALDQATCHVLIERARYRPAQDAAGRPMESTDDGRIIWYLPDSPGAAPRILAPPPVPVAMPYPPAPSSGIRPNLSPPPQRTRANLNSYFSMDDYPVAAIRARHMGTTGFRLTVGVDGRVTDCEIVGSSGSEPLDAATCRILRSRARYTPARDREGTPVEGHDSGRVTWRLPDSPDDRAGLAMAYVPARSLTPGAGRMNAADVPPGAPPPSGEAISELRVAVGREGQVIGCDIETSSGSPDLDAAACRLFSARARFTPGRDAAGAAVCDVTWIGIEWRRAAAAPRPGQRAPVLSLPVSLGEQLNARLCSGWPVTGRGAQMAPPLRPPGTPGAYPYPIIRPGPPAPPAPPSYRPRAVPPQRARINLNSYFSIADYPAAALRAREQGIAGLSLTIDPSGRVSACTVTESSGSATLDAATCRILRSRASYTPARNADGNPVSGPDYGRVTWRLPDSPGASARPVATAPAPPAPPPRERPPQRARANLNTYFSVDDYPAIIHPAIDGRRRDDMVGFSLAVGPDGRVTNCRVTSSSGLAALDSATCRILTRRARYLPARDAGGNPAEGTDSGRIIWRPPFDDRFGRAGVPHATYAGIRLTDPGRLVSADDYPPEARPARAAGTSVLRLVVGPAGRVVACDVARSSGTATLDAAACRLLVERSRYQAATDFDGEPVCDVDTAEIAWTPQPPPVLDAPRFPTPSQPPPPLERQLSAGLCPGLPGPSTAPAPPLTQIAGAAPPRRIGGNLQMHFSEEDYPAAARRDRREGVTGVHLTVDARGRVTDCAVTASSGTVALDYAACWILRERALYYPASDARGDAVAGTDDGRVVWRLPPD